jgi:hypothetical protein
MDNSGRWGRSPWGKRAPSRDKGCPTGRQWLALVHWIEVIRVYFLAASWSHEQESSQAFGFTAMPYSTESYRSPLGQLLEVDALDTR